MTKIEKIFKKLSRYKKKIQYYVENTNKYK